MSTLDDFFGDSKNAKPECSYCGLQTGELIVTISDANGPTHWMHPACIVVYEEEKALETAKNIAEVERHIAIDEEENYLRSH